MAKIVSIDAWREPGGGWSWNDQRLLRELPASEVPKGSRRVLRMLRELGYLTDASKGTVRVEYAGSDPEIIEVQDRHTGEPLIAIKIDYAECEDGA